MPLITVEQLIEEAKSKSGGNVNPILPTSGIPSSGGSAQNLTAWTVMTFYPDGGPAPKNRPTVSGRGGAAGSTWVLPLPLELAEVHSLNYNSQEMGIIERALTTGIVGDGTEALKGLGISLGTGILDAFGASGVSTVVLSKTRRAANPQMEALFKTPNLRVFNFSWNLIPLTSQDSSSIKSFVKEVRQNIYPTVAGASAATTLTFPSEFTFQFQSRGLSSGTPNTIFETMSSVITEFTVSYGAQGMFGTHEDGLPTQVTINMTVQETFTAVKDDFA
jgi:hypothetical protein